MSGDAPSPLPGPGPAWTLTAGAWGVFWLTFLMAGPLGDPVLGLALGMGAGFGGLGTWAARRVPPPVEARLGLRGFPPRRLGIVLLLAPAVLWVSELDNWVKLLLDAGTDAASPDAIGTLGTLEWVLFAVGLRPVLEEFFFRGVLLQSAGARLGSARGLALVTLLFALVRAASPFGAGDAYRMASLGTGALLEGALLGASRLASGSILATILLQALWGGLGLAAVSAAHQLPIAGFNAPGAHTPAVWLVPSALLMAAGLLWARSAARSSTSLAEQAPAPRPGL